MKTLKFWALVVLSSALVFFTFYGMIAMIDENLKARYPETTEEVVEKTIPEQTETETELEEREPEIIFTPIETEGETDEDVDCKVSEIPVLESSKETQPSLLEVPTGGYKTVEYGLVLNESNSSQVSEVMLLAKIIMNEAGMDFATDEHQRSVASVVVNRVNDPRFPNTIYDVLMAGWYDDGPIQYGFGSPERFFSLEPSQRAIDNAMYVLTYGSTVGDAVWQAEFIQGEIVAYFDYNMPGLLPTYICR